MGHSKQTRASDQESGANVKRYERAVERERKRNMFEEMVNELPGMVSELVNEIVTEEAGLIASQQIDIGMQYINIGAGCRESSDHECQCGCASRIKDLEKELAHCKLTIENLTKKLMIIQIHSVKKALLVVMNIQSFILSYRTLNW